MDALPSVSILVPTFGRLAMLAESVECFRRQDYAGHLQLIVCNDCPVHTLTIHKDATERGNRTAQVINLAEALPNLATKRNLLLENASGDLMCAWDDDDIYLPGMISALVAKYHASEPAARTTRIMHWDGRIAKVLPGVLNHNAIFLTEWVRNLGGWRTDVVTTDHDFTMRAVRKGAWRGRHHHVDDGKAPLFVYRGDPGRTHMEGGTPERHRLTVAEFQRRQIALVSKDRKQRGDVVVVPKWSQDWEAFVVEHLPKSPAVAKVKAKPKAKGKK